MGLLVTAYTNVRPAQNVVTEDWEAYDTRYGKPAENTFIALYLPTDSVRQAGELVHGKAYTYDRMEHFWNHSYTYYYRWHLALGGLVPYVGVPGSPFDELLSFPDNEGVICCAVSKKLAADFAMFDEEARAAFAPFGYDVYKAFRACFEMASQDGAVHFH